MKYKYVAKDSLDLWLTEGRIYEGEPLIPPLTKDENWIKIYSADDGYPTFVRAFQMQRVFDKSDEAGV